MRYLLICLLLVSGAGSLYSQNTNSPYSILGIGDIDNNSYNRTAGMANTGFAYRNDRFLINNNPAAYTGLIRQFFSFEVAGRAQFSSYAGTPLSNGTASNKDFAIKRVAVGTKINKWWGSSAGIMPYSSANYTFSSVKNIQGTNATVPVQYEGDGGVNQVYWGNAFEIWKNHLSVGVNSSYLFGSLNQTENLVTEGLQTTLTTNRQVFLKNFKFTYGGQFYTPIGKHWDVSIGGVYAPKMTLAGDATITVTDNGTQISKVTDKTRSYDFKLPNSSGFGFSITKDKKYTLSADYQTQDWTSTHYTGLNYALTNSKRISVGFEVSNASQYRLNNQTLLFERSFLQVGGYYGDSYLTVNGKQLKDMGISFGYGVNSKKNPIGLTLGLQVGQRGTKDAGLIRENYVSFSLAISYRDFWLTKGRRYN